MTLIDLIIFLIIGYGVFSGFRNGFTKQLVLFIGFLVFLALSYMFKNPVSEILYNYLPFFKFGGVLKGVTALNILIYEVIALLIVLSILMIIFRLLLSLTNIFETILKFTIILGIPSKILGAVVGFVQYYLIAFLFLYIVSLPVFNIKGVDDSKFRNEILNNTPVLSKLNSKQITVFDELKILKEKYKENYDSNQFNLEAVDLFLKYKVVTVSSVKVLNEKGKLDISGIDSVLDEYQED